MTDLAKKTATQRRNRHDMADAQRRFEWAIHHSIEATDHTLRNSPPSTA